MSYFFSRQLDTDFVDAEKRVVRQLEEEGFGVLTEIDVQATLKKKLDVDFTPYKILGAALQVESHVDTMLPCNVILRASERGHRNFSRRPTRLDASHQQSRTRVVCRGDR